MQPFAKENNGYQYMLHVVDVLSKFAWSVPLEVPINRTVNSYFFHDVEEYDGFYEVSSKPGVVKQIHHYKLDTMY